MDATCKTPAGKSGACQDIQQTHIKIPSYFPGNYPEHYCSVWGINFRLS